jgi:hypothetical protein
MDSKDTASNGLCRAHFHHRLRKKPRIDVAPVILPGLFWQSSAKWKNIGKRKKHRYERFSQKTRSTKNAPGGLGSSSRAGAFSHY